MPDLSPLSHRLYLAEIERLARAGRLPAPPLPHRLAAAIRRLRRRMRLAPPALVSPAS